MFPPTVPSTATIRQAVARSRLWAEPVGTQRWQKIVNWHGFMNAGLLRLIIYWCHASQLAFRDKLTHHLRQSRRLLRLTLRP